MKLFDRKDPPKREWSPCETSEDDVRMYFAGASAHDMAVPYAVAKQIEFQILRELRNPKVRDPYELARLQGELIGLNRFRGLYRNLAAESRGEGTVGAGGEHA